MLAGAWLSVRSQRRIEDVNLRVQRIIAGNLRERLPHQHVDEPFSRLAAIVNGMLDELETTINALDGVGKDIAHDLRTPLTRARLTLERGRNNATTLEQFQETADKAIAGIDQSLSIITALLRLAEIENSRRSAAFGKVAVHEMLREICDIYEPIAEEKQIALSVVATGKLCVRGDRDLLLEAVVNLVDNAIKFTPQGEVDVRVSVFAQADGVQTLEMTVEDTGIGIAPEVQNRLFEPFVQAESSTTRRFGGTGLGLTICRKLIDLMGGSLALHSEPGSGTRMTVRLDMAVETQRYSVNGLRGKRGLVATGDARVAQALMHFGEALGLTLRRVPPDAPELRDRVALANLDLLFVNEDVTLPADVRPRTRVICLTEKPKPTGYRILDDNVRLSINPISWRGLGAACAAAMTGLPSVPRSAGTPRAPEGGPPPPDRERAIASGRLILVAEDHPVNQELIRHQLALLGFACDVTNDGAEALAALQRTSYGCLITDCHMPNVSGYELTRRIREGEEGGAHRLPILGITANTAPEDLNLCRDAGMDDSLVKPTRLATLRDYLSRWFGSDSAAHAAPSESVGAPAIAATDVQGGADPFVPVDLGHMTQLWGSESTVKALLDSFVSSVREDVQSLSPLLERVGSERTELERVREWLHRVAGAASVLQYPPLLMALEDYRREINVKPPERVRNDGMVLINKCNAMLDGIEQQAALLV